jgi:predicted nuclease of restriction endonuclease-like (RecB) superfamily
MSTKEKATQEKGTQEKATKEKSAKEKKTGAKRKPAVPAVPRRVRLAPGTAVAPVSLAPGLLDDVRSLIDAARQQTARAVNSAMVVTYWGIGERIRREVLGDDRAEYGKQVVERLAAQLTTEYGSGFTRAALFRMVQFAEAFPSGQIVATLSRQLSWSHVVELLTLTDPLRREFYAQMCATEHWSVRTLRRKMDGMLFERTGISRQPEELAVRELEALRDEDRMSAELVFRDEYVLDFLGLKGGFDERDLEEAILREMERFIAELGSDFAFVARQKRMTVDGIDYRLDLLFFHRRLRRLIAIDLKLGRFRAAYKGQMELYLRWLEKYEQRPGEDPPLGLILCAGKSEDHVELLQLEKSGIRVAEYLTELPPMSVLEAKLHAALASARRRVKGASEVP